MKTTPTKKCLNLLEEKGYKILAWGGSGFVLPKYWHIQRPDKTTFWATKMKQLKEELLR